jgi:hypothetical protein
MHGYCDVSQSYMTSVWPSKSLTCSQPSLQLESAASSRWTMHLLTSKQPVQDLGGTPHTMQVTPTARALRYDCNFKWSVSVHSDRTRTLAQRMPLLLKQDGCYLVKQRGLLGREASSTSGGCTQPVPMTDAMHAGHTPFGSQFWNLQLTG